MANETHILRASEVIECTPTTIFQVLTDISREYKHFAPSTSHVELLTPDMEFGKGYRWRERRRVLYLREDCNFTVTDYDDEALILGVQMDDGFNRVQYSFRVLPREPRSAVVQYRVDCLMRYQGREVETYQPSERLACLMAKQDGLLVKRLKSHIESCYQVRCC